ncbi:hypothetical protein M5J15_15525 [Serratia symbiotica]|nr:hypothetical protein [Serratia symbiotica]USS96872.1 hypothetical protein M5J15_15525 [Serratia symbiotica]
MCTHTRWQLEVNSHTWGSRQKNVTRHRPLSAGSIHGVPRRTTCNHQPGLPARGLVNNLLLSIYIHNAYPFCRWRFR